MTADRAWCEKKTRERHDPLPFVPLVLSERVSRFLLGSCVGAWPCLGAGSLGQLRRPEREVRNGVTGSSRRGERSGDARERVARTVTSSATSWDMYMCPRVRPPRVTRVQLLA